MPTCSGIPFQLLMQIIRQLFGGGEMRVLVMVLSSVISISVEVHLVMHKS